MINVALHSIAPDLTRMIEADDAAGIEVLVGNGADIEIAGDDEITPLIYAVMLGRPNAAAALLSVGADALHNASSIGSAMSLSTRVADPTCLQAILSAGISPQAAGPDGRPVIFTAVCDGTLVATQTLLDSGADPNSMDHHGGHVLLAAARAYNFDAVNLLLDRSADPTLSERNLSDLLFAMPFRHGSPSDERRCAILSRLAERGKHFSRDFS